MTTHLPGALIRSSLALLSPSDRASFYNLSYVNLPAHITPDHPAWDDALALAIMQTNAISAGDDTGIFPRTARLNHGCSSAFNSVYTWREHEGVLVVHALKPIHKGQVSNIIPCLLDCGDSPCYAFFSRNCSRRIQIPNVPVRNAGALAQPHSIMLMQTIDGAFLDFSYETIMALHVNAASAPFRTWTPRYRIRGCPR